MIRTALTAVVLLLPSGVPATQPVVTETPPDAPAMDSPSSMPIVATNAKAPFAGDLCLRVTVVGGVNLVRRDPALPDGHPALDPAGQRHGWVYAGSLDGIAVVDTRPEAPGWAVSGSLGGGVDDPAGWAPALVARGSDPEGAVAVGPVVPATPGTPSSTSLGGRGSALATAGPGNGLGTQRLAASVELWQDDTVPAGSDQHTLTLTLVSP